MRMASSNISQLNLDIDNVAATMNASNITINWLLNKDFNGTGNATVMPMNCIKLYDNTVGMHIFIIILLLVNIVLHSTGCLLLHSVIKKGKASVQQLLILNLSVSELLKNLGKLYRYSVTLSGQFYALPPRVCEVYDYVKLGHRWGTYLLYFLMMVYITVDRLLLTLLKITYEVHVTKTKAKRFLVATWICVVSLVVGMSVAHHKGFRTPPLLPAYLYAGLHIFFVVLATCTYTLMFHKFARSGRPRNLRKEKGKDSLLGSYRQSPLFIGSLIITSFIVLAIIPGLVYIYLILNNIHRRYPHTKLTVHICFMLSDTVDACIYIFLQRSVRSILVEKLKSVYKWCVCAKGDDADDTRGDRIPNQTEFTSIVGMEMVQMLNTS